MKPVLAPATLLAIACTAVPSSHQPTTSLAPPTPSATAETDWPADHTPLIASGPFVHDGTELIPGTRYHSMRFTEPFEFVMPVADPTVPRGHAWSWGEGVFRIANGYSWTLFFVDDVALAKNVCNSRDGILADVPATPADVGTWLRASERVSVAQERDMIVDGRVAKVFEFDDQECPGLWQPPLEPGEFYFGFRVYAIPTRDDTILFTPWSDGGSLPFIESAADELASSIKFD